MRYFPSCCNGITFQLNLFTAMTTETDPVKIESDLKALLPKSRWRQLSMRLIQYGRDVCDARKPRCFDCRLENLCPYPDKRMSE